MTADTDPHSDESRRPNALIVLVGTPLAILGLIVGTVILAMKLFG